jgi:hypothetical protein
VLAGAALAPAARASHLRFGSRLAAAATLDTANGAAYANADRPRGPTVIGPNPHDAADTAVWNAQGGSTSAPRAGQVLAVKLKGCAREDRSAPSQLSVGVPVNEVHFQTLAPQPGGGYRVEVTSGAFRVPFCGARVDGDTVTSFRPVHMCIGRGDTVDFNDLGGFIPARSGPSWYPQGVPFMILAPVPGSAIESFVGGDQTDNGAVFEPGARPTPTSGFGSTAGDQLLLAVVEGVGGDAYALCPGGTANEPSATSNAVACVYGAPSDGHPSCGGKPARHAHRCRHRQARCVRSRASRRRW